MPAQTVHQAMLPAAAAASSSSLLSVSSPVKWIGSDGAGLPLKRKQVAQACDVCRRRKKRCTHADNVAGGGHPATYAEAATSVPTMTTTTTTAAPAPRYHSPGDDDDDEDADSTKVAANRLMELSSARFISDMNPEGMFIQAASPTLPATGTSYRDSNDLGVWLPTSATAAVAEGDAEPRRRRRRRHRHRRSLSNSLGSTNGNGNGNGNGNDNGNGNGNGGSGSDSGSDDESSNNSDSDPYPDDDDDVDHNHNHHHHTVAGPVGPTERAMGGAALPPPPLRHPPYVLPAGQRRPSRASRPSRTSRPARSALADAARLFERGRNVFVKECLAELPPPADFAVLHRIYCEKVHPLFPVLKDTELQRTGRQDEALHEDAGTDPGLGNGHGQAPATPPSSVSGFFLTVVKQLIAMAAAITDAEAAGPHMRLGRAGPSGLLPPLLPPREFHRRLTDALLFVLESEAVVARLHRIDYVRSLILVSFFYQPSAATDSNKPALLCTLAIHHFHTLGAHLLGYRAQVADDDIDRTFCALWALDRLSALLYARPCMMNDTDNGKNAEDCAERQPACFRLFLSVILWLDKVINLYRPRQPFVLVDIPVYEALILDAKAEKLPAMFVGTIEVLYHTVCVLSCRQPSSVFSEPPDTNGRAYLPLSIMNPRRSHSSDRIVWVTQTQPICFFPYVPFAVSIALSVQYKKMRYSRTPIFRTRSRAGFRDVVALLKSMGDVFHSARVSTALGERIWKQMEMTATSLAREELEGGGGGGATRSDDQQQLEQRSGDRRHQHHASPASSVLATTAVATTPKMAAALAGGVPTTDYGGAQAQRRSPSGSSQPGFPDSLANTQQATMPPPLPPPLPAPAPLLPQQLAQPQQPTQPPQPPQPSQPSQTPQPPQPPQPQQADFLSLALVQHQQHQQQPQPQPQQQQPFPSDQQQAASIDLSVLDTDIDLFGNFDPSFDLGAIDTALEANLDMGIPQQWTPWNNIMIDPKDRIRRAIHANDQLLVNRILHSHPQLLHNPDTAGPAALSNSNLHLAASLGHLGICQLLVERGHEADGPALNENHETALMLAARAGHTETVHYLCQADPRWILRRDSHGRDAIMEASRGGHDTVVQILLTYAPGGATAAVRREDHEGNTALHFASGNGHLLVLRTLLAAGADADHKNIWRWTPVAYSASVQAEVYLKTLANQNKAQAQAQAQATTQTRKSSVGAAEESRRGLAATGLRLVRESS